LRRENPGAAPTGSRHISAAGGDWNFAPVQTLQRDSEIKRPYGGCSMSKPVNITDDTFEAEVLQSELPVVVDFWATWCGPCKMIAPILEEVATEMDGRVKIAKLDVDTNNKTAGKYNIMSIPSLLFFKKGEIVDQVVGALPKAQLLARLQKVLN
jgi:thioredoxin 1